MPKTPKLLFVLSDGGRARLVERSPDNGHYRTVKEISGATALKGLRRELRSSPPGRSFASTGSRRAAVGADAYLRDAKARFVESVADHAAAVCRRQGMDGVVIVAPSRLIGDLGASFDGKAAVAGAIRKDLTKIPNAELGAWLNHVFAIPSLAR